MAIPSSPSPEAAAEAARKKERSQKLRYYLYGAVVIIVAAGTFFSPKDAKATAKGGVAVAQPAGFADWVSAPLTNAAWQGVELPSRVRFSFRTRCNGVPGKAIWQYRLNGDDRTVQTVVPGKGVDLEFEPSFFEWRLVDAGGGPITTDKLQYHFWSQ